MASAAVAASVTSRFAPLVSAAPGVTGETDLWNEVLWQVLVDLALSDREIRSAAEAWIGKWPSRDFVEVCDCCGLHPGRVHAFLRDEVLSLPWEARRIFVGDAGRLGHDRRRVQL